MKCSFTHSTICVPNTAKCMVKRNQQYLSLFREVRAQISEYAEIPIERKMRLWIVYNLLLKYKYTQWNETISCVCVHTFLAILLVAKVPFRHMLLRLLIFLDDHNVEWISMTFRELHMRLQLQLSMGLHRYSFNMWWKQIGGLDWIEIMYAIEKSNKRER